MCCVVMIFCGRTSATWLQVWVYYWPVMFVFRLIFDNLNKLFILFWWHSISKFRDETFIGSEKCNALHLVYIIKECGMTSLSISTVSTSAYFIVLPIAYLICCQLLTSCVAVIAYFIVLPSLLTSLCCRHCLLHCVAVIAYFIIAMPSALPKVLPPLSFSI